MATSSSDVLFIVSINVGSRKYRVGVGVGGGGGVGYYVDEGNQRPLMERWKEGRKCLI